MGVRGWDREGGSERVGVFQPPSSGDTFFKPKDAAPTTSTIQGAPSTSCQETVLAGEESDSTVSSEEGDDSATPQV